MIGHRHRSGVRSDNRPTGRRVNLDENGIDTVDIGEGRNAHSVMINARIINCGNGINKLIIKPDEDITKGQLEIVTRGENGRSMQLIVKEANSPNATTENGRIVLRNMQAGCKYSIEFKLFETHNFAMGVKAYGD